MAKTITYTIQRFNGTDLDILYPKAITSNMVETTKYRILKVDTHKINGKSFFNSTTNVDQGITLTGADIKVDGSTNAETIAAFLNAIDSKITNNVTYTGTLAVDKFAIFSNTTGAVKASSYGYTTTVTAGSADVVSSGGVKTAIDNLGLKAASKKDVATTITEDDAKLPTGGAVYSAIDTAKSYLKGLIDNINSFEYVLVTSAADTPKGVSWTAKNGDTITGTLVASASTANKIYLVPHSHSSNDVLDEYISVVVNTDYQWEKLGNTDINLSSYTKFTGTIAADYIMIGASAGTIKASAIKLSKSLTNDDVTIPTGKAIISYLGSWAGSANITTVGTITTGTWHGSAIASSYIANLASSKITALTGYVVASSYSEISASDSLNTALGKLQKGVSEAKAKQQIHYKTSTDDLTGVATGDLVFIADAW